MFLSELAPPYSEDVAKATRIQYGGSVNDGNCAELAQYSDVDGFLVVGLVMSRLFIVVVFFFFFWNFKSLGFRVILLINLC